MTTARLIFVPIMRYIQVSCVNWNNEFKIKFDVHAFLKSILGKLKSVEFARVFSG